MKKILLFSVIMLGVVCVTFAQTIVSLDEAIQNGAREIEARLNKGVKVVVLNFNSPAERFSNYVLDELMVSLVNGGKIVVVDRQNLALIQQEMNFQMSGEVSDASAQEIGMKLGAQSIISGAMEDMGNSFRVRLRTIEVVSAAIQVMTSANIKKDNQTSILLSGTSSAVTTDLAAQSEINSAEQWKSNWLYVGFNAGYSAMIEDGGMNWMLNIPLAFSLYLLVQPVDLFGIAIDLGGDLYAGPSISLVPTLTIRPSQFEIDLFLGAGLQLYNGYTTILGGVRAGYKAGPGVIYAELRPMGILGNGDVALNMNIALGYQLGFIPRNK